MTPIFQLTNVNYKTSLRVVSDHTEFYRFTDSLLAYSLNVWALPQRIFETQLIPRLADLTVLGLEILTIGNSMIQGSHPKNFRELTVEERDSLLIEHLPVVRYVALHIHRKLPHFIDLEDLTSAGVVGLIDAVSKFDHARNVEFKSYAEFRIRGAILDSLRALDWSPSELRRKGRTVAEAIRMLSQRDGHVPLEDEIASEMQVPLADYQALLRDLKGLEIASLHKRQFEDSIDEALDSIPSVSEASPLSLFLKSEIEGRLTNKIEELPKSEQRVLKMYYFDELTMKQIGTILGVAEARISQIHSSAVVKLRLALREFKPAMWAGLARSLPGAVAGRSIVPPAIRSAAMPSRREIRLSS